MYPRPPTSKAHQLTWFTTTTRKSHACQRDIQSEAPSHKRRIFNQISSTQTVQLTKAEYLEHWQACKEIDTKIENLKRLVCCGLPILLEQGA